MPCNQNEYLLSRNVYVDLFRRNSEIVFLTHVHSDHLSGFFSHVNRVSIYCTAETAKLLTIRYGNTHNIHTNMFQILEYSQPVQFLYNLYVEIFPSFHCSGSCMFYFYNQDKSWSCFYTGDFRMLFSSKDIITQRLPKTKLPRHVGTLYIDDSYRHIQFKYPSLQDLLTIQWIPLMNKIRNFKNHHSVNPLYIYFNANVLGIERLLMHLYQSSNRIILFMFHHAMSPSRKAEMLWICRSQQNMFSTFPHSLSENKTKRVEIVLTDKKTTQIIQNGILNNEINDAFLILPGVYHFTKNGQVKHLNGVHHDHILHVFFSTHANQYEINALNQTISSEDTVYCNDQIL